MCQLILTISEDAYRKFLIPKIIENITDFDVDTIVEMVTATTPAIQETISTDIYKILKFRIFNLLFVYLSFASDVQSIFFAEHY